jgi:hypothetical protein
MRNIFYLAVVIAGALVVGLFSVASAFDDDYLGDASSGLVFTPGKGYSWPAMGGPVTRYYYDPSGRSHLVEVDPFTLDVRRSPVDPNSIDDPRGRSRDR